MDTEKELTEMAIMNKSYIHTLMDAAYELRKNGYGNIRQAIEEFADKLKARLESKEIVGGFQIVRYKSQDEVYVEVDNLVKEFIDTIMSA